MNRQDLKKVLFLGIVVAIVFASKELYPAFSSPGQAATIGASDSASGSSAGRPPLLVLPALLANDSAASPTSGIQQNNASTSGSTLNQSTIFYKTGDAIPPQLDDNAGLVADLETGAVFFNDNAGKR